jgi:hypothetical protein
MILSCVALLGQKNGIFPSLVSETDNQSQKRMGKAVVTIKQGHQEAPKALYT